MNFTKLMVAICCTSVISLKAQQNIAVDNHNHEHIDEFYLPLEFDKDSLKGFNEEAAWQQATMSTDQEWRQKRIVAVLKRNFIDFKYGFSKAGPDPTVQGPCSNPDFETGSLAGWTATQGPNNNSLTMAGCCPNTTSQAVIVTAGTDPNVPVIQRVPPGGGNFTCRLGPTGVSSGGTSYRLTQSFTVTPANSVFIYRYAVLLNKAPHTCSEQPFFNVSFKDCSGNPIPCGQYNVTAIGSSCSSGDPSFVTSGSWAYKDWTTAAFDLTSYIGQCVNLEFTVAGCVASQGAHGGYAYIDASCQPMTLNLNGTDIPVGQTNSSFCGASTTNTLCAPPGFTYNWSGPGVSGQVGQCVNTSSSGTFSVTLGVAGTTCSFSPVLYSTFNSAPNPTVTASLTQPVCLLPAGTATINTSGGTGPYTYSWTPAAPSSSVNTNLPAGTSYSVSATDVNGCSGTTSFSIDPYPPAPSYTLDVSPSYSLSCSSPSTTITFAPTNTSTANQWQGPSGAITGTNVVVTAPGVYTYTTVNTVSTCSLTGSINITGSINMPVLTSTLSQPSCVSPVGSATVSVVNGTAPYTYSWSPTVTAPTDTINSNLPPGTSYTVSVTDDLGCIALTSFSINPFSGAPLYALSNNPSLLITCASPSTTLTFAPTNTNTSTSWTGPSGVISGTTTVATAMAAGTYSYVALNTVSTCSVAGTFVVTADTIKPTATYTIGCNTTTISLNASSTPSVELDWITPFTPTTSIGNPATSTALGVYTLTAFNPNNGCLQTYTASTSVPPISVVTSPTTNVLTCIVNTITATTSPAATSSLVVTWNNGVTTSTVNPYLITSGGTYTTIVQVVNGCSSQSVITVSTNTVVNVNIIPTSTLITCATGSVNLTAVSSVGGPYSYSWTPGVVTFTGTQFPVTASGIYTVVALNTVNGCTATATQAIGIESINASFVADVYQGQMPLPVSFTNTSSNPAGTNYTWDFGDGHGFASNDTTVSHLYNSQGNFPVVLTATNGFCTDTAMRYIKVDLISLFEVPNVFTPNGDGKNDVFTFRAINMGEITITIFDRWGLKMFEGTDTGNVRWDGKNKSGKTVTDGTYFYILTATGLDGVQYDKQGTINVFQ
ncbi:MAG: gliding motility-associated C-terminal domain-containing protein [Bacteroidota bacterium]